MIKYLYFLLLLITVSACRNTPEATPIEKEEHSKLSVAENHSTYLLTVAEVANLKPEEVVIIEVGTAIGFSEGHLPNAYNLGRPDYENAQDYPYGGMMASRSVVANLLGQMGVQPDDLILLYDNRACVDAVRLLWILKTYGHHRVAVMEGGKTAWKLLGHPLSYDGVKQKEPTAYRFAAAESRSHYASMEEVAAASQDTNTILLDTRGRPEFEGKPYISNGKLYRYKRGSYAAGCIPGAQQLDWSASVNLDGDHRFKSPTAIQQIMDAKGITKDKTIITYCQSGVRSAHMAFVLTELLDYPKVKNYDGSWIEWSYHYKEQQTVEIEQHIPPETADAIHQQLKAKLVADRPI